MTDPHLTTDHILQSVRPRDNQKLNNGDNLNILEECPAARLELSLARRGTEKEESSPEMGHSPGPVSWVGALLSASGHLELDCAVPLLNINHFKEQQYWARPLRQDTNKIIL